MFTAVSAWQAMRTMPWCLQLSPGHPTVCGVSSSPAAGGATESPAADTDPLAGAAIHPGVLALQEQIVADRRLLHVHAELSFEEDFTSTFVVERLRSLGLEPVTGLGRAPPEFDGAGGGNYVRRDRGTGLTCTIEGGAGPG
jgi:hypothetical protein